jgi:AbiV family abortive infection protein
MGDASLEGGFLEPIKDLTLGQIGEACEAAFENASGLLEEADILRGHGRCARAYFLAHIACEELGKLPILTALAVSVWMETEVDWATVDRALRSHGAKIKQVLFMDSLQGESGFREGTEAYEADLRRLRTYTDMKNASLYSFHVDGRFLRPNDGIPCEMFDSLRGLAEGRLRAFAAYLQPMRLAGGLDAFFKGQWITRANDLMERLLGDEGRAAFREFEESGDETAIRSLFERLVTGSGGSDEADEADEAGEPEPLSEERLAEERQRMRELTSRPPDFRTQ